MKIAVLETGLIGAYAIKKDLPPFVGRLDKGRAYASARHHQAKCGVWCMLQMEAYQEPYVMVHRGYGGGAHGQATALHSSQATNFEKLLVMAAITHIRYALVYKRAP